MKRRGHSTGRSVRQGWLHIVAVGCGVCACILAPCPLPHAPAFAAQLPSLFRGVVIADSQLGVRVVSVEETSQAYLADLRPEDIIVRVGSTEIHSIDEFATLSNALKGRAVSTTLLVFRNGSPRELLMHLYSYPILHAWGIEFVPDHDLRFAQPQTGRDYWLRMARGFEDAGNDAGALNAYLNALHNVPDDLESAVHVATLLARHSQQRLRAGALPEGLASLQRTLQVMQKLFDSPLSEEQLQLMKRDLRDTLDALRAASSPQKSRGQLAIQTSV